MTPEVFISKVCHDLRAPLRGMKEIPNWIEDDLKSYFEPIPDSVMELLNMLKMQATQLDVIVIGLSELAKIVRSEESVETSIQSTFRDDDWPDNLRRILAVDVVPLERAHLKLVILHLVENAFVHANAEQNAAELSVTQEKDGCHIAVKDFGPGIDNQYFSRIFEPLYSLKSRDESGAGGMGLAVVAKIATLYQGKYTVFPNSDGVGLTFEIVIPVVEANARKLGLEA